MRWEFLGFAILKGGKYDGMQVSEVAKKLAKQATSKQVDLFVKNINLSMQIVGETLVIDDTDSHVVYRLEYGRFAEFHFESEVALEEGAVA